MAIIKGNYENYHISELKNGYCFICQKYIQSDLYEIYGVGSGPKATRYLGLVCENSLKRMLEPQMEKTVD